MFAHVALLLLLFVEDLLLQTTVELVVLDVAHFADLVLFPVVEWQLPLDRDRLSWISVRVA